MSFSSASIDFLIENVMQDSRDWFRDHKQTYIDVLLSPFSHLVERLTPGMLEIDPLLITDPRVDRTLSRIHRDTRFSQDKSLYRDKMWFVFMREKKLYEGLPAFYFELSPEGFNYGMGYYQASTASMEAIRQLVGADTPKFRLADNAYRAQDIFVMDGDTYKRSRHPNASEHQREWMDKKSISFNCHSDDEELLFSDGLAEHLLTGYHMLAPVYDFLCQAEAQREI